MTKQLISIRWFIDNLIKTWQWLNGDTAYQTYLIHWHTYHAETGSSPLTRKAYFAAETKRKWNGIKRCC